MSDASGQCRRLGMRIVVYAMFVGGSLGLYAGGYYYLHHGPIPAGGFARECADSANRTVYYPINYLYQRWIWNKDIPWSGRIACTFLAPHANYGFIGPPRDGMPRAAWQPSARLRFVVGSGKGVHPLYEKAQRDYDAWYQKALRGEVDPGVPIAELPDFFSATFIITYTQRVTTRWYSSYGETEIEFLSIDGRGLPAP